MNALPSFTIPVPIAAAALSPAPPTTTVSVLSPDNLANSSLICPVTSGDSYTFANKFLSISSFSKISSDH